MAGFPYITNTTLGGNRYLRSGVRVFDFAELGFGIYPRTFDTGNGDTTAMVVVWEDGVVQVIPVTPFSWSYNEIQDFKLRERLGFFPWDFRQTPVIPIAPRDTGSKIVAVLPDGNNFALIYRRNAASSEARYAASYHSWNPTIRQFDAPHVSYYTTELLQSNIGILVEYAQFSEFPDKKTLLFHSAPFDTFGYSPGAQQVGFSQNSSRNDELFGFFPRWNALNISGAYVGGSVGVGGYGAIAYPGFTMKSDDNRNLGLVHFWGASRFFSVQHGELKQPEKIVMTDGFGCAVLNSDKTLAVYWDPGLFSPSHRPWVPWQALFPSDIPESERWQIDGSTIEDIFTPSKNLSLGPVFLLSKNSQYPYRRLAQFFIAVGSGNEGRFPYWEIVPAPESNFQDGFYIPPFGFKGAVRQALTGVLDDNFEDAGPPGNLRLGFNAPINMYLGNSPVEKIYRGARLVYP